MSEHDPAKTQAPKDPPAPRRWKPRRCGLINVFRYDDQPLYFEDGHLLIRGHNGAGKSRVLALTLPFLFDGEARASRLEPDGDANKRVEWNLLLSEHDERTGYTWIEFERPGVAASDVPERCTLAIGLRARRGRPGVRTWFVVTDRPVGPGEGELALIKNGFPATRQELKDLPDVSYFEAAKDYRHTVDQRLFGLGDERYAALVDLLLELRKPQLSRGLDEAGLSRTLSQSLPPMPAGVLGVAARAFEGLETQKTELAQLRDARRSTAAFLKVYRRYARLAARRFAEPVRQTHSAYEAAGEASRKAKAAAEAAAAELDESRKQQTEAQAERDANAARIRAYEADPAMRSAARLRDLARLAREARSRAQRQSALADQSAAQARDRAKESDDAAARLQARAQRAEEHARAAAAAAHEAGLEDAFGNAAPALPPDPDRDRAPAALDRLLRLTEDRRAAARQLQGLDKTCVAARTLSEQRRVQLADQQARFEEARETLTQAEARAQSAARTHADALTRWTTGLTELDLDPATLNAAADPWYRATLEADPYDPQPETFPPAALAADRARGTRQSLAADHARLRQTLATLTAQRDALSAEKKNLEAGHHAPPPAPHTRAADARADPERPGAPFWRLIDFQNAYPEAQRPGLEAALESAGLLDAWVNPAGRLDGLPHDHALVAPPNAAAPTDPSLADALTGVADPAALNGVDPADLTRLLQSIALGSPTPVSEHEQPNAAVDPVGRFRLGPLHGRWSKPAVEHIGQTARDTQRARRLTEISRELAVNAAALGDTQHAEKQIEARQQTLETELVTLPPVAPVLAAVTRRDDAATHQTKERERLARREAETLAAREKLREAVEHLSREADRLDLSDWLTRLTELHEATATCRAQLAQLREDLTNQFEAADELERARQRQHVALTAAQEAATTRDTANCEADAAEAERATLEATAGDDVRAIETKLRAAQARAAEIDQALTRLQETIEDAIDTRATTAADSAAADQRRDENETRRDDAIARLQAFVREGLLAVGEARDPVPAPAPADDDETAPQPSRLDKLLPEIPDGEAEADTAPWSPTRGVHIARAINDTYHEPFNDDAFGRSTKSLTTAFHRLKEDLSRQNLTATLDPLFGNAALRIRIRLTQAEQPVPDVLAGLTEQIKNREELLTADEQTLIENHLIAQAADELHRRIHEARGHVHAMSAELESRSTATGMQMRFRWETDPDDPQPEQTHAALNLLKRPPTQLPPDDRAALGRFLQTQITRARESMAGASWAECLAAALDYRRWHRFLVQKRADPSDDYRTITRRTFGTGSGGEKALMLTLPRFAAASAHYNSASIAGPRLILLDEAFAGIDPINRAQSMAVLQAFDLDFVMTSDRERGCYAALKGNSIYHLSTAAGADAVLATRQVWRGNQLLDPEDHGPAFPEAEGPPDDTGRAGPSLFDAEEEEEEEEDSDA